LHLLSLGDVDVMCKKDKKSLRFSEIMTGAS